ncbi:MAG: hypothetical protein BWX84_02742 [Verrucomicrobia bacterium ADurb.Bin118]|nr:MAG: hypothetical protein BWX84_02742 [Verrucomicrobia bacterium ADurb.Bin118]
MIFLAELQRLPVGVGHEFARGETLPVDQGRQSRVFLATRLSQIRHQFGVEFFAALLQ